MTEKHSLPQNTLEEMLISYAEQVQASSDPISIPMSDDKELKALQETVLLLHGEDDEAPTAETAAQIKTNVVKAWEKQYQPKPAWSNLADKPSADSSREKYLPPSQRRRRMVVQVAAAAALVIIAAFILIPSIDLSGGTTSGTAIGELGPWLYLLGLLVAGGFGLWWWLTSRRK